MKKLLSSVMAIAMVASMSTMAFAADVTTLMVNDSSKIYKENDGILYEMKNDEYIKPGEKIYVEIFSEDSKKITASDVKYHKVVSEWISGGDVFQKVAIENKKTAEKSGKYSIKKGDKAPFGLKDSYDTLEELTIALNEAKKHDELCKLKDCDDPNHILPLSEKDKADVMKLYTEVYTNDYRYFVAVYTKSSHNVKPVDFIGSVKILKKNQSTSTSAETKVINTVVAFDKAEVTGSFHNVDNSQPVLDFSNAEGEVELTFGDMAMFVVNVTNQSDLHMGYTTKPDTKILDQNPNANIEFLSFEAKPSFGRIGTMMLMNNEEIYVYENTNTGLKEIKVQYDEDYEAYAFKTRNLTSYVISDRELKFVNDSVEIPSESEKPSVKPDTTDKENPPTGAGNGMIAAVLMLTLSTAGAAAIIKKVK